MYQVLLAGLGGFIGSSLRFLMNKWIYSLMEYPIFPLGILIINVLGCLIIGFFGGLAESREVFSPDTRVFVFIGLLGGFTTFSSFGYDTFGLWRNGQLFLALLNVVLQVGLGLLAVWFGYLCSRILT